MSTGKGTGAATRFKKRLMGTTVKTKRRSVAVATFVLVVLIMSLDVASFGSLVQSGKPSSRTITAPRTVQYLDKTLTREEQAAAAAAVPDVLDYDEAVKTLILSDITSFFEVLDEVSAAGGDTAVQVAEVDRRIGKNVYIRAVEDLLAMTPGRRRFVRDSALAAASKEMEKRVTADDLDEAYGEARQIVIEGSSDEEVQRYAVEVLLAFLEPNSVVDKEETEKRKAAAREGVRPVITTRLGGEVLVEKGEVVSREKAELLKTLGFARPAFSLMNLLYVSIFALALLAISGLFLAKARRPYFDSPSLLALLGGMAVTYTALAKVLLIASNTLGSYWAYLVPSAAIAFLAAVLFDIGIAIMMVIICGLITGVVSQGNFAVTGFALLGGLFPALMVTRQSTRHEQRRAGLYTAFWLSFVAFAASALTPLGQDEFLSAGIGLLNGAICGVAAMGSLPFLETTFGITTNTWLLELASPEQELLRELSVRAPGTYSHSVMVANLAEAASREIGSDPMLARVSAYYHDVGKMKRPQFFIENQPADCNPHEAISPNLSALIIISHVKDGVEMLEKSHVPEEIIDIVREHHGTTLVKFFYQEALEAGGKGSVEESRFRYHFDKPRRKTAGIILLADAVEATARTLSRRNPASIEQMVDRIVDGRLEDGQLDECDLTYSDVKKAKKAFTRILISTYHPRVDYPLTPGSIGGRRKVEGQDSNKNTVGKAERAPSQAAPPANAQRGNTPS